MHGLPHAGAAEVIRLESFKDCPDCPEIVVLPPGEFSMGSPLSEEGRRENEGPQQRVNIRYRFGVSRYEITFDQWDQCVESSACGNYVPDDEGWGRKGRPVVNVNWYDARAYTEWLSNLTGNEYRLLSEAEWEYAARAGTTTPYYWGHEASDDMARFGDGKSEEGSSVPVGSYPPNPFGLYDMSGNVSEWVLDNIEATLVLGYNRTPYTDVPNDGSPKTTSHHNIRVVRGGSWFSDPKVIRSATRIAQHSTGRFPDFGFRVAREIVEE